jgi:hypothetical protein
MNVREIKPIAVSIGALVFPGLGHLIIGKWARAFLFAFAILMLFAFGLLQEGRLYALDFDQPIYNLPFLADLSIGIPYFLAKNYGYGAGDMQNQSYDYGTTFLIVAGLLNLLVVLNAFDVATGKKK